MLYVITNMDRWKIEELLGFCVKDACAGRFSPFCDLVGTWIRIQACRRRKNFVILTQRMGHFEVCLETNRRFRCVLGLNIRFFTLCCLCLGKACVFISISSNIPLIFGDLYLVSSSVSENLAFLAFLAIPVPEFRKFFDFHIGTSFFSSNLPL